MTTRLVVTGPESTGKTTLARDLATMLGAPFVAEASRAYAEEVRAHGKDLGASDVEPIARRQMEDEDTALRDHPRVVVLDTDLISTVVYARHYYGACPAWIEKTARARLGALYLLCATDIPWAADGVRYRPAARGEIHALFASTLSEFGARVVPVSGLGPSRLREASGALRTALPEHMAR